MVITLAGPAFLTVFSWFLTAGKTGTGKTSMQVIVILK